MAFGLTDNGFNAKPLETIKSDIEADLKANIAPGLNVSSTSVLGNLISIFSNAVSDLWSTGSAITAAYDPAAATGTPLDNLASLTGVIRKPATNSTVTATVNLNNGVTLSAGSKAYVSGNTSAVFVTLVAVTNSSGIAANFSVAMVSEETGPVVANAGTLTVILTPVAGWNSITNAADAVLGIVEETDSALRIRRQKELTAQGAATVEAIKAGVLSVENVSDVIVFENTTLTTDGAGVPGKAFETVVLGGLDADIAAELFTYKKSAGTQAYGTSSSVVVDSQGFSHTIGFTRPTSKTLYANVILDVDDSSYPADGDIQVQNALDAYMDANLSIGDDVVISKLYKSIYAVSGINDVTSLKVYDASTLSAENLNETDFATHAKWDVTGGFDASSGAAVYTHGSGVGTLTQTVAHQAIAGIGARWYKFGYTVSGVSSGCAAAITAAFGASAQSLTLSNGVKTLYFYSGDAPANFVISATSTSGGFTIDNVTLKSITEASTNYVIGQREVAVMDPSRVGVNS